jgi:hypothetical protein
VLRGSMKYLVRLSLLAVALSCTSSWAQSGSMSHNPVSSSGFGPVASSPSANSSVANRRPGGPGRPGFCNNGNCLGNRRGRFNPNYYSSAYWGYSPYSYGGLDPYWELGEPAEAQSSPSQQQPIIVFREPGNASPPPPASPQVIEVPPGKTAEGKQVSPTNPVPPAVFILKSGQRIEAQRYLLTHDTLQVQQGRDQQTIPLNEVNLEATIAANHTRGIDLHIPENRNQLTLGF